jgi:hypothetical protein
MSAELERTRAELLSLLHPRSHRTAGAEDGDVFPRSSLMRAIIHGGRGWALVALSAVALVAAYRRRSPRALLPLLGLIAGTRSRMLEHRAAVTQAALRPRVTSGATGTDGPGRGSA